MILKTIIAVISLCILSADEWILFTSFHDTVYILKYGLLKCSKFYSLNVFVFFYILFFVVDVHQTDV